MSQAQTKIVISGQDNASPVMRRVGDNARQLTERVTALGRVTATFFGAGAAVASFGVMGREALEAARSVDSLDKVFASITGSASAAEVKLDQIRELSDRLGLNFLSTAQAAKGFFAAGEGTELAGDMDRIFESVMTASTALGLSADESNRTLLALQQMISKGKVSAEELRQQLGEALPGAFKLFADAAGVSTAELDRMLERGEVGLELLPRFADLVREKYQGGVLAASRGVTAELNRLGNAWFDFKASLMDADQAASAVRGLTAVLENVTDNGDDYFRVLQVGLPTLLAFAAAQKAANAELGKSARSFRTFVAAADESRAAALAEARTTLENALATDKASQSRLRQAQAVVSALKLQKQYIVETEAAIQVEKRLELAYLEVGAAQKAAAASSATLASAQGRMTSLTTGMGKAMGVVGTSIALVKKGASGLVGFLGGPWGAAFTGAAAAAAWLASKQSLAEEATTLQSGALRNLNAVLRESADGMMKFAEVNQEVARAKLLLAVEQQEEAVRKLGDSLKLLDFGSATGFMPAFREQAQALDELIEEARGGRGSWEEVRTAVAALIGELDEAGESGSMLGRRLHEALEQADAAVEAEKKLGTMNAALVRASDSAFLVNVALEKTTQILGRLGRAAASSGLKLDEALGKSEFARYLASLSDRQKAAANALKGAGLDQAAISRALAGDLAEFGDDADTIKRIIDNSYAAAVSKTASSAESARSRLEQLRREIDELHGRGSSLDASLAKKLEDIAKAGRDAGMAAPDVRALRDAYESAFNADRARDFAAALDKVRQQTEALTGGGRARRAAENLRALTDAGAELAGKASTPQDMIRGSAALAGLWGGLRKQNAIEDLQTFADFYRQYGELTGKYGASQELQTRIVRNQIRAWQEAGVAMEDTLEMEKLLLQESSRDPFEGMTRGLRKFGAEATDLAAGFESMFSNAFSATGDALAEFVRTGRISVSDLVNSMIADFARLAGRSAMGSLASGLGGLLGSFFGGFDVSSPGSWTGLLDTSLSFLKLHDGGAVGGQTPSGRLPAALWEHAPRLHGGGLLRDDERAAILQTGERVLSRRESADLDHTLRVLDNARRLFAASVTAEASRAAEGGGVTVNVYNYSSEPVSRKAGTDRQGNRTLDIYVGDMAAKQALTPGSPLNRAVRHQTGQPQPVIKR